jgi:tRNA(Ser,Leu) C12 N-acetylase TAN1
MRDWNVVVSVRDKGFTDALRILKQFGSAERTRYYNVLVMRVADIGDFLERLRDLAGNLPDVFEVISRVAPAAEAFDFGSPEEFEDKTRAVALQWVPRLAGKTFHVRLHRRGFKGVLTSPHEERFIDEAVLAALAARGTPGSISFSSPDAVIDIETVNGRAGMALWTREDLARYLFLRAD